MTVKELEPFKVTKKEIEDDAGFQLLLEEIELLEEDEKGEIKKKVKESKDKNKESAPSLIGFSYNNKKVLAKSNHSKTIPMLLAKDGGWTNDSEPFNNKTGIYFWVLKDSKEDMYSIYIGQTTNLINRLADYSRGFQSNSVDDYKLRFFIEIFTEANSGKDFNLSLFFMKIEKTENQTDEDFKKGLKFLERKFICKFSPLVNDIEKSKEDLKKAYKSAFKHKANLEKDYKAKETNK
jgi:hypothetical protein